MLSKIKKEIKINLENLCGVAVCLRPREQATMNYQPAICMRK